MDEYVKLIRFHNNGFRTRSYNSSYSFSHSLSFIDYEVNDLEIRNKKINEKDIIYPKHDDHNWNGCFVFLEEYDKNLLKDDGALRMRKGHQKNVGYLKANNQTVWVRNNPPTRKGDTYINRSFKNYRHEGKDYISDEYLGFFAHLFWVRMKVDMALKRIALGKQKMGCVPEWLSEAYITDDQVNQLKFSSAFKLKQQVNRIKGGTLYQKIVFQI